jgi:hypothetical protein
MWFASSADFRAQTLRRHLRIAHGLEAADYRTRWSFADGLSIDRTKLFGSALEGRQGDRFRAPSRCGTEPDGNSAARHVAGVVAGRGHPRAT